LVTGSMKVLRLKLIREIGRGKARFFAATFLVFLGMALFLSTWLSYNSLDHSYKSASEQLCYNDFIIEVSKAPDDVAAGLGKIDGVSAVTARLVLESGCYMPNGNNIICQLVGMPTGSQPQVNQVLVEKGSYFQEGADYSCLAEAHLADYYVIAPSAEIDVITPSGREQMEVVGTASSAEYFLITSPRSGIAAPQNFGVIFVPLQWLQRNFAWQGNSNQFAFLVDSGADAEQVMASAVNELAPYGVLSATLGDDTEARQLLDLDVEGFRQISIFFPILFLSVAALSLFMIITRIVHMQRPQIGTMMAFGVSRRQLSIHYFSFALLVGSIGAITGLVAGYFIGTWFTHLYAEQLGIPLVSTVMDWEAVIAGFIASLVACFLASVLPIRRLMKLAPALVISDTDEGIRSVTHRSLLERLVPPLRRIGIYIKVPLRNLSRSPRRALLNILGIALAFMLVLVSLALLDSMNDAFNFYFDDFVRYDADVYFSTPELYSEQIGDITEIAPVKEDSPYLLSPGRFDAGGDVLGEGLVQAVPRDTDLLGFYGTDGEELQIPEQGALLSDWFRDGLGLNEGDTVRVETSVGSLDMEVKGFVKQIGGLSAYMDLSWIQGLAGSDLVNGILVTSTGPQGNKLRDDLLQIPGAAGVEIPEFTKEEMRSEYMGLMYLFAGIMILFAAGMAIALIYNTINIAYLERETEIAVMMAMGTKFRRIGEMFTLENMLVGVMAVIPGVLAGYGLSVFMMKTFSTEYFSAPAVIRPVSYVITILGVLVFVLIAEAPSLKSAKNIDIATMIRDRIR
jgi:putative ABC transport system permease protein